MESFGEKADPRALASEGHLDSLGLCIFLAFVKKFNKECPLVILDDVVTTIDAQHRSRIAKLLLTEFKDYQLIITTSDGIWYEQIINSQRALGVQGNFVNDTITNWDIYTGPRLSKYKPQWDSIQDKLNGNDKCSAGNQGRIYLEWLLKKICEQLEVSVPFKSSGKYTVSELLNAAEKRIKEKIKNTNTKKEILKKFEDVRSTAFMGNLLSHDNPETTNLSIEEVKIFCEGVHNLHEMFLCPTCGKFLKYFRDSKIIRCPDLKCKSPKIWETK